MKSFLRTACGAAIACAILVQGAPLHAQQTGAGAVAQQTPLPVQIQPSNSAAPIVQSQTVPVSSDVPAAPENATKPTTAVSHLRELSPWSMFLSADILVKAVIIGLVFASLVTWTIFFAKTFQLARAQKQLSGALARIADLRSLSEAQLALGSTVNVLTTLLAAATQEVRLSADSGGESSIKERAASRFSEIVRMEARAVRYGMAAVATIGATAPFVGLFGTVWGIMNSFIGISVAQTTNLAVVAPGIAEALLATAVGLGAAIPAVIIYNHFSRVTRSYLDLVGRGSGAIGRLLSRDLDRIQGQMISRAAE
jgi:biopolymer transport protein ExbB